jgi:hypothetical protein
VSIGSSFCIDIYYDEVNGLSPVVELILGDRMSHSNSFIRAWSVSMA